MPGVAFVAHCLLNQNSKTHGGARCPGVYSPLVEELRERGWRIEQMPCPELAFTGLHRFWAVKEQLDTAAYRRHCRRIAAAVAGAIEVHVRRGDDVILVGIEGSPSMGVHVTSSDPERGGRPEWPDGTRRALAGQRHLHRGDRGRAGRARRRRRRGRWASRTSSPTTTRPPSGRRSRTHGGGLGGRRQRAASASRWSPASS